MGIKNSKKLFDEFTPIKTQEWEEQIVKDLKGADYEKKLIWKTLEGINIKPYYRNEDNEQLGLLDINPGEFPYARGSKTDDNNWLVRQDFEVPDIDKTNEKIRTAIEKGANSIGIKACIKEIDTPDKFSALLKDIDIEKIPVNFSVGKGTSKFIDFLVADCNSRKINHLKISGSFGFDFIGHLTSCGNFYFNEDEDIKLLVETVKKCRKELPGFKAVAVNAHNFVNAGATAVQELAYAISNGNEYLDLMTSSGINTDDAANSIHFRFGIGNSYFIEIAKIRAARLLWPAIVKEYKPSDVTVAKMFIHSETASINKTIFDPYVNLLRTTTESMSAALGGTDSLTVKPFDSVFSKEPEISSRLARNTQIILKEEAYLDKIADPAAGSYYIENLTHSIAEHAWQLFLEIEDQGGYIAAIKSGFIQKQIENIASQRKQLIAQRRETLLGTNQYPNSSEKITGKTDEKLAFSHIPQKNTNAIVQPIKPLRISEEFEQLRLNVEKCNKTPKVFLLTIGNLTMRKARATFSYNFFGCAGYEVIDNNGFNSSEEGVKAALNANADIVVICSSDDEYAELAPKINTLLKDKCIVVVAGAPSCMDELKTKGIRHFIHMKANALESLQGFNNLLNIK